MDRVPVPERETQCEPAARVLVVGACLLEGPPGCVHRGAIPPDHQLHGVVTGRLVVAASVVVVAAVVAAATVGRGCA
jgi:hypothetical protein